MDHNKRRGALATALTKKKLGAYLVTSPESRRYFSGFTAEDLDCRESSGLLLVFRNESYLFTDGRYETQARMETSGINIVVQKNGVETAVQRILRQTPVRRVGFEASSISVKLMEKIKGACEDVEFIPADDLAQHYRLQKDPEELEAIKSAVRVGEECLEYALKEIRPGMTEKEAAWKILRYIYERSDGPSFPPIVASGPNSALPHAVPSERVIEEGEPVIIDMGVKVSGYASDMTRTFFFGEPTGQIKDIYMCVKEAKEEAQKGIRAGITGKEADSIARRIIKKAGYGNYFSHSLGHGVGLSVHEAPVLSPRYRRRLHTNSVVTVEPGIYIPGKGGVRLEDMGVIKEDCLEVLGSGKWYYDF